MNTLTATSLFETARNRRQALGDRHELHGTVQACCTNGDCSVREVTFFVKEYDARTPDTLACPACRQTLDIHDVVVNDTCWTPREERRWRRSLHYLLWQTVAHALRPTHFRMPPKLSRDVARRFSGSARALRYNRIR